MGEVKARPFVLLYHKVVAETITMNYEYQQIRKSGSLDPKCPSAAGVLSSYRSSVSSGFFNFIGNYETGL